MKFSIPFVLQLFVAVAAQAQLAGKAGPDELVIAQKGRAEATIVVAADAGKWEKRAAEDLQKYLAKMTGGEAGLGADAPAGGAAILVGAAAIKADPSLTA